VNAISPIVAGAALIDLSDMQRIINHPNASRINLSLTISSARMDSLFSAVICPCAIHYYGTGDTAQAAVDDAVAKWRAAEPERIAA